MMHAIAIDDELNALGIIEEFCKRIDDIDLLQTFTDPTKALQFTTETKTGIDLVFLDIQMSRLNGLALASHLPPGSHIILTTAYPDYALQGYEMDIVDYLLKPFSFERFERAVKKVRLLMQGEGDQKEKAHAKIQPSGSDFIFVRTDYKTMRVQINEILYIEGSGNYVTLHTTKGKIMVLQNLKKFEEQLHPYHFVRVHKSFIVSLKHIESIEKGWILIAKEEVPIGESYKEAFQQFLNENYRQF